MASPLRSMIKIVSTVATIAVVLVATAACGNSNGTGKSSNDLTVVRIGVGAPTAEHSLPEVAQELGFFKKYGIDAKVQLITAGGPTVTAALVGGNVDFGVYSGPSLEEAVVQGTSLKYVGVWMHQANAEIVGAPGINSMKDLKGKPVAVSAPGGLSGQLTDKALRDAGLDPTKAVVRRNVSGQAAALSAFASGQVKAALFGGPQAYVALDKVKGAKVLVDFTKENYAWPGVGVVATGSYIKNHSKTIRSVVAALKEAAAAYQDPAQASKIKAVIAKFTQIDDQSVITRSFDVVSKSIDPTLVPRAADEANVLMQVAYTEPKATKFSPADMFDAGFTGTGK